MFKTIKFVAVILLIALSVPAQAKTRHFGNNIGNARTQGLLDGVDAKRFSPSEIEARFRPFLEDRVRERRGGGFGGFRSTRAARPSERDLFLLMKAWDNLSAEFRALYSEATAIPKNPDTIISPMGKFKIYYTTTGRDSVDVTDTIGYGVKGQPSAWRVRNSASNGIPDYIDEAAFALDSAWSMEIGRFKFPDPITAAGREYYPIYINLMDDYGATYPLNKFLGTGAGFSSHIEINSNWSGPDWVNIGYDKRPYDALKVTCAHEFFHAVQYAMVWNRDLDDFPIGWLEGSAVLMEEIAYPEVNDYFQYIGDFFLNPRITLLVDNNYTYMNSILLKYLYEKTNNSDSIGFVRTMHANNADRRGTSFHDNIDRVSESHAKKNWAEALNCFHAESYFTGKKRARPWAFVTDSDSMRSWTIPVALSGAKTQKVKPYSVELFHYKPQADHPDTLMLNIIGQIDQHITGNTWGASVLVMEKNDSVRIERVSMNKNGIGYFKLADWKEKNGGLLVVTNASPDTEREITVTPEGEGFVNPADTAQNITVTVSHNVVKLRSAKQPIRIFGGGVTEVKIYSPDGKLVWIGKNSANGAVEWIPDKRLTPGAYFMTATSSNSGKKNTRKQKIMILP